MEILHNRLIITGDSGTGKTFIIKMIKRVSKVNSWPYVFIDNDTDRTVLNRIAAGRSNGVLYFIDNADILLNDKLKEIVSFDTKNQYIIMSHCFDGYMTNAKSVAELQVKENKFTLVYRGRNRGKR